MAEQPAILLTVPFPADRLEQVRALAEPRGLRVLQQRFADTDAGTWGEVEVLHTIFDLPLPERAPRLRWVQLFTAGAEHVLAHPLAATDVVVTTSSGIHAVQIAEHVFTMLLSRFHNRVQMLDLERRGEWPANAVEALVADTLWGKTIGIVGYGSIGRQVARLAQAFGMRVLAMQRGTDRRDRGYALPGVGDPEGALPERYYGPTELRDLLAESDVVVLALPRTPQTEGMLDEAAFRAMKPGAYLVNVGRAAMYDEPVLLRALREGWIAGAALDVFHQEPLPVDSPLWGLPNVDISPHVSGTATSLDWQMADVFVENLRHYLAGEPLVNVVDLAQGY